jgi:polar amino acid transport system substrate-binding protein
VTRRRWTTIAALAALALALVGLLPAGSAPARAATLSLRADEWCPYTCTDPDRPGYMVEVARAALGAHGHEVDFRIMGWARAIEEARAGRYTGVVGAVAEEVQGFVLSGPLGSWRLAGLARPGLTFDFDTSPLEGVVLGLIKGYDYGERMNAYAAAHGHDPRRVQFASGDDALAQNLRKLAAGRVDVVVDDPGALLFAARAGGLGHLRPGRPSAVAEPLVVAFSPAEPRARELAALLDGGVERLRADGTLAAILAGYGLTDWAAGAE